MLYKRKLKKRFLQEIKDRYTGDYFDISSENLKRVMEEKDINISNYETRNEDQDLKNDEILFKAVAAEIKVKEKVCVKNSIRPVRQNSNSEFPAIEIIKVEDEEDEIQEITTSYEPEMSDISQNLATDLFNQSSDLNDSCTKRVLLKEFPKRDFFPDPDKYSELYELQNFKCCMVEHTYCKLERNCLESINDSFNKENNTRFNTENSTTLAFENSFECYENRTEQQTIDESHSVTKHVDFESYSRDNGSIKDRLRKRPVDTNIDSNVTSAPGLIGENSKTKSPKNQSPKTRERSSNGKRGFIKIGGEDSPSGAKYPLISNRESNVEINFVKSSDFKKLVPNFAEKSFSPNKALSLDEIAKEISEMEKLLQSKCEVLNERHNDNNQLKAVEVVPSKMRKLSNTEEVSDLQKDGEYVLSMHKLTKAVAEKKNWNLEYSEDDVKNLGIDDLLLRASELNAENFTKALGQNSSGRSNNNKGDGSNIVLTFPGSRRDSDEALVGENSKGGNSKKTKIEFLKKCIKDDKISKSADEESEKKVPEVSPKRPGIKVKTVQNINEEFKDALGAKLKNFEARNIVPDSTKTLYTIADELQKKSLIQDGKDQINTSSTNLLTGRKTIKAQDQDTGAKECPEESRPFVMTIIQNKDNAVKDHVPPVSTPKLFVKSKPICSDSGNLLSQLEEQVCEVSTSKKSEIGDVRNATENITLVVSEPKTSKEFEVVNVDEYIPDMSTKNNSHFVVNYGSFSKKKDIERNILMRGNYSKSSRKKTIPITLNSSKKCLSIRSSNNHKVISQMEDSNKGMKSLPRPPNRLNAQSMEKAANVQGEKPMLSEKATFTVKSIEQKILPKDAPGGIGGGIGKLIRLPTNESTPKNTKPAEAGIRSEEQSNSDAENDEVSQSKQSVMTLAAFSNILKDILPDKWVLSLDKRYGLQIIKIHLDELLNPSIMISVVVGRTGKVTVNVRGRQLEKSHDLFSNLCDIANSNEKISINYILAIINKLRFFNVCFGCDDLSLKKYWCEDGFIEYYTEFQQTYRSHICESLVRSGRKRCYPCYRMHESLKKRKRREQLLKKTDPDSSSKSIDSVKNGNDNDSLQNHNHHARGVKRNLEEFLEESFINMKQKIADEIEKTKGDEENEKVPKTQDEVLSFMGLTRKESLDINLRKSKREKKGFKKCKSLISNNVNKEELYFLEKYWPEINVLFSTSLLIGAYSRTSTGRLREKCTMFHKLLSTWRGIIRDNQDWVGGNINLAEGLFYESEPANAELVREKFDNMDIPALRAYIINCVKEVNKIKSRLRTKNNYFKVLYNTFVKPRMKKARQNSEPSENSTGGILLDSTSVKDLTKEVGTSDKIDESIKFSISTEVESSDENSHLGSNVVACISDDN